MYENGDTSAELHIFWKFSESVKKKNLSLPLKTELGKVGVYNLVFFAMYRQYAQGIST